MRKTALFVALITTIILSGCAKVRVNGTTVIGGSDGPTAIYLAPEADKEEFLSGTWVTASQGYEYYGTPQAEYYVRFESTDIIYGHMKDGEFMPDHTNTVSLIEQTDGGGCIVKAKTADGAKYSYRSAESDMDTLNYYSTWNEDDFPGNYHAGASLTRIHDNVSDLSVKNTYESDFGTYYEMDDGTWMYDGRNYKYRLEITGRLNNAAKDSTFVYLSNIEDISFDRAAMASGLSSNMDDYFPPEEAVFVGWEE